MPLSLSEGTAQLVGVVSVDEAEPLAQWLRDRSGGSASPKVGLARCTALHTAALQALLAARPVVVAPPTDPFLVSWVLPLLAAGEESAVLDGEEPADADDAVETGPVLDAAEKAEAEVLAELAELDEFDGLELDESLVIPAALAALAEPEAELI